MFTPCVVCICRYQEGVTGSKLFRDIGNVTEETKFSFEYSTRPPSEVPAGLLDGLTELPFQVQIRYTRLNGMQCVRVITRSQVGCFLAIALCFWGNVVAFIETGTCSRKC